MKRADITNIFPEATKEQIDALMALNGNDINAQKAEIDALNSQLATAQAAASRANPDALAAAQAKLAEMESKLEAMTTADSLRQMREKVAEELKVPAKLLTADTEEACKTQAQAALAFAHSIGSLSVGDGGEAQVTGKPSTRAQFADWANQNLN